jgi:hypothetical protein
MRHHRLTRSAALGLAVVALAAPTAAAQSQDLRSPDARDSTPAARIVQDLRTPDTRDAAAGRPVNAGMPTPSVNMVAPTPPVQSTDPGFDWGDAGIGAGILLALILLGLGSTLAVVHRRHGAPAPRETATTG